MQAARITEFLVSGILLLSASTLNAQVSVPNLPVVAKANLKLEDFFLYYPLPDKTWREVEGSMPVYYEGDGVEIYVSRDASLNMVFPMTFGDTLYFSSRALPGMGGYDLFYCAWDDEMGEWGEPVNMGLPYNSPEDDFLFVQTPDGKYSLFASTRGCEEDNINVYVIDRTQAPVVVEDPTPEELEDICALRVNAAEGKIDSAGATGTESHEDPWSEKYKAKVAREREIRKLLASCEDEAQEALLREELGTVLEEKARLEEHMLNNPRLENIDMEADREVIGIEGSYLFTRKSPGERIRVIFIEN